MPSVNKQLLSFSRTRYDLIGGIVLFSISIIAFIFTFVVNLSLIFANLVQGRSNVIPLNIIILNSVFILTKMYTSYKYSSWPFNLILILGLVEMISSLLTFTAGEEMNTTPLIGTSIIINVLMFVSVFR